MTGVIWQAEKRTEKRSRSRLSPRHRPRGCRAEHADKCRSKCKSVVDETDIDSSKPVAVCTPTSMSTKRNTTYD